jgi:hypothetical protein
MPLGRRVFAEIANPIAVFCGFQAISVSEECTPRPSPGPLQEPTMKPFAYFQVLPHSAQAASADLHDQALAQAHALREAAIADFWRGTDAWLMAQADQASRAARRFAARLARHRAGRVAQAAAQPAPQAASRVAHSPTNGLATPWTAKAAIAPAHVPNLQANGLGPQAVDAQAS